MDEEKIIEVFLDVLILKIKYDNKLKIINEVFFYIIWIVVYVFFLLLVKVENKNVGSVNLYK